jgi:glycosyltransferase involved in cell wall biosynthesis
MSATQPKLRVGLNLLYLEEESGGSGTYARELIPALLRDPQPLRLTLFSSEDAPEWLVDSDWSADVEHVRLPVRAGRRSGKSIPITMTSQWALMPWITARRGLDVLHGLANVVPPVTPRTVAVVTVLDVIWLAHPETMARRATLGMKLLTPISARRARRVIALTEAAKTRIAGSLRIPHRRIDVTPLGVTTSATARPESELRERLQLADDPVVLCVGQKREHKNLLGLVRAFARLDDANARLVLVGSRTEHESELRDEAAALGVAHRVVLAGWVTDTELAGLYELAHCFVLPSFEEGFGLPVIEAMARGTAVACSDIPALRELAGDAALLFDPHRPDEIAGAVGRVILDAGLREDLARRGLERSRRFRWSETASATVETYLRALGRCT